jgi:serine/threonine protein phosphatase PrpC
MDYSMDTGTTSCVILITPDKIFCANAGDSRGTLSRSNKVVELSFDHKPDNEEEERRIQRANHYVSDSRVDGNLALSRAFGDF